MLSSVESSSCSRSRVPRRARFAPVRRVKSKLPAGQSATPPSSDQSIAQTSSASLAAVTEEGRQLFHIARDLWTGNYGPLFIQELERNRAALGHQCDEPSIVQTSRYARSLRGERAEAFQRKLLARERDQLAIQLRTHNMRHWSPSLVARSIAYFNLTTSWQHGVETGQRRLASRPTTFKVLRMMRAQQPAADWEAGVHVSVYAFDQTYEWVGMAKRGRRQAVETVDATGMPMAITHEVYVNSIYVPVPATFGNLSPADLLAIANNNGSPYTEDYNDLFDFIRPSMVRSYLREFSSDALLSVQMVCAREMCSPPSLTLPQIANALFGRRQIYPGGPSFFDILEPLMQCDTKSYSDGIKILRHLFAHSPRTTVVDVALGDGQSVILLKNMKKRWPKLYARLLIAVGGFHEHAHTMFALNEMFWESLLCRCYSVIGITKIFKVTKDLEHNNYAHVQQGLHVVTIAIMAYLLQDVVEPRPSLLLRDPEAYLQQVESATGVVLVRYLQYAGFPTLQWQRSARGGDGGKLKKLFAYSFHVFRSVAHKPVCTQVALIALLGFCCALPSLQTVLMVTVSLSMLGRMDSNMFVDRIMEYINKIQQGSKRSAHAASFGRALDLTTLLRAMIHVRHAFQAVETGEVESDDGVKESWLIMARMLQDELVRVLGRDLTVRDPLNHMWHTGNAVPLDTGDFRMRRPWEWIWRVAFGTSAGKWRSRAETWLAFAHRMVTLNFFRF